MLVKVLGLIDLAGALAFLFAIFGFNVFTPYLLGCAMLLLLKGLFVLTGDVLSVIDLFAALVLIVMAFITPPVIFMWLPAFLLIAKGFVSFL